MVALALLVVGVLFNLFLITLIFFKYRDRVARTLMVVAGGLIWWEIANYLSDTSFEPLLWNRLTFIGPLIVIVASYLFVTYLLAQRPRFIQQAFLLYGTFIVALLCLTPLVVVTVEPRLSLGSVEGYDPIRGVGYWVFVGWIFVLLVFLAKKIFSSVHHGTQKQRAQLQLIRIGVIVAILIAVITNLLVPIFSQSSSSARFIPIISVVYIGALSIAILKHNMLDIRDFVLRAAVFSFTTTLLGILFIAPVIVGLFVVTGNDLGLQEFIIFTIVGTLVATNYNRLYLWFSRISNQIFYRETYDPTKLMSELNRVLLGTIDAHELFTRTARVATSHLKADYCYFILEAKEDRGKTLRLFGGGTNKSIGELAKDLLPALNNTKHDDIIYVETLDQDSPLRALFTAHDVAVIVTMHDIAAPERIDTNGYMVISMRKSGKPYNSSDLEVIEAISSTLTIAIRDALHFEEIKSFNQTLQTKVDTATVELRMTNRKLLHLDEAKDEFVSMASHQLRTPLTSVKGYISMVLEGDAGELNVQQRKLLEEAYASSQRMVYLIGDFLNVSRLKTGKFMIEASQVDLASLVGEEVDQLQSAAAARQLKIVYSPPHNLPLLAIDENKIRQVVMNFVDNAIFYGSPPGEIRVELSKSPHHVVLKVHDNGIGVPKSERHHLFTKFYRASNAKRVRPDGTGIGLFMAKKVIIAHGGDVLFETVEGKGSMFGFRLPLPRN